MKFELTLEALVKLHKSQGGRCAISGVPFDTEPGRPFSMSLDRINVNVGYVIDNLRIVAAILNPIDNSAMRNDKEDTGSWTPDRYEFAMQCAMKRYG